MSDLYPTRHRRLTERSDISDCFHTSVCDEAGEFDMPVRGGWEGAKTVRLLSLSRDPHFRLHIYEVYPRHFTRSSVHEQVATT